MPEKNKRLKIFILSDGTGKTAKDLMRAALAQFKNIDSVFTIKKNIRDINFLSSLILEAKLNYDLIVYSIVERDIRSQIKELTEINQIPSIDILGDALEKIADSLKQSPVSSPGSFRSTGQDYYQRIQAIDFTLNSDSSGDIETLEQADVILIGISRTSKTPLSIFLSLEGLKVANMTLNFKKDLPESFYKLDQKKIVGLTSTVDALQSIRKQRVLKRNDVAKPQDYTKIDTISQEIKWANNIFEKNPLWPVFDITLTSLEEIALEILKLLEMRQANKIKHEKRFS
jgi:hypothetical protein